jgi:hypothetical protein
VARVFSDRYVNVSEVERGVIAFRILKLSSRTTGRRIVPVLRSVPMASSISRCCVVCAFGVAVSGCAPPAGPSIVGRWDTPTGGMIEFRDDGTAIMAGPSGERQVQYRQPNAKSLELSLPDTGTTIRWQIVSVSESELVVKDADGIESHLPRTKVAGVMAEPATAPPGPATAVP